MNDSFLYIYQEGPVGAVGNAKRFPSDCGKRCSYLSTCSQPISKRLSHQEFLAFSTIAAASIGHALQPKSDPPKRQENPSLLIQREWYRWWPYDERRNPSRRARALAEITRSMGRGAGQRNRRGTPAIDAQRLNWLRRRRAIRSGGGAHPLAATRRLLRSVMVAA